MFFVFSLLFYTQRYKALKPSKCPSSLPPGSARLPIHIPSLSLHFPQQQDAQQVRFSSPDFPTWHKESSGPARRPCPAGWGCYPSSQSPSRIEHLPPEGRPLWSARDTQTDRFRKKKKHKEARDGFAACLATKCLRRTLKSDICCLSDINLHAACAQLCVWLRKEFVAVREAPCDVIEGKRRTSFLILCIQTLAVTAGSSLPSDVGNNAGLI